MGPEKWSTNLARVQAKSYAVKEEAWFSMLEAMPDCQREDPMLYAYPTAAEMGLGGGGSPYLVSKNWHDEFTSRSEYRRRELQSVTAKDAMAVDVTFQVPARIGMKGGAAVATVETGEVADIMPVDSEAYDHKKKWLQGLSRRPTWQPKVAFYDTAPDRAEEMKQDTKAEAVAPDLLHELMNITSKCNNFNKRYKKVSKALSDAFLNHDSVDIEAIDNLLLQGQWEGRLGSLGPVKAGTVFAKEQIEQLKRTRYVESADRAKIDVTPSPYFSTFKNNIRTHFNAEKVIQTKLKQVLEDTLREEKEEYRPVALGPGATAAMLEIERAKNSVFSSEAIKAINRAMRHRAGLFDLPPTFNEFIKVGTDKCGLPIWRSNGRGTFFCEAANGAWKEWVPKGNHSTLHGVSLTLDGVASYNMGIREKVSTSWGVGPLMDWWHPERTNASCTRLGLQPRYPNLEVPPALRDGELGIAGGLVKEFRQPAAVRRERKVDQLATEKIPLLALKAKEVEVEREAKRQKKLAAAPPPVLALAPVDESALPREEEEGWEEVVKTEGGASGSGSGSSRVHLSSTREVDEKLANLAARRLGHRAAVKHLLSLGITCECHVAAEKAKSGSKVGKKTHAVSCPYIIGLRRLTKG